MSKEEWRNLATLAWVFFLTLALGKLIEASWNHTELQPFPFLAFFFTGFLIKFAERIISSWYQP